MDWFERLTGFRETGYADTRAQLAIEGRQLVSKVNGQRYGIGDLELVSLQTLRDRVRAGDARPGKLSVRNLSGDVRALHSDPEFAGALFQVASQFNLLEMVGPDITPEQGVTRYQHDRTQGPACAMAAGAATIYRNYFAPVAGEAGQTRDRQLDGLADMGVALGSALGMPVSALWTMRNGYALGTEAGLIAIGKHLRGLGEDGRDALRATVCIGLHSEVDVTDGDAEPRQTVSQVFCSALPVAYSQVRAEIWQPFAKLVLEAAYEATLLAALRMPRREAQNTVLLTQLGGGAFGNDVAWIDTAMRRALTQVLGFDLDVRIVNYGAPSAVMLELERAFVRTRR